VGEPSFSGDVPAIGDGRDLGLVAADFHEEIAEAMLDHARERAKELGFSPGPTVRVPGTYDAPLPVQRLLKQEGVAGAGVVGAIVTGETRHDRLIGHSTARSLQQVSLDQGKPVGLAITGPGQSYEQAEERVPRARDAVDAVARSLDGLEDLEA
jgi:6,7-dimethyl-8-ribityllumazine synthase